MSRNDQAAAVTLHPVSQSLMTMTVNLTAMNAKIPTFDDLSVSTQ
jgi:hypothetical protein